MAGLKRRVDAMPGVVNTHHIHAWSLTSGKTVVSAHVLVEADAGTDLLERITILLRDEYPVYFSTIQLEQRCIGEEPRALEFLPPVLPESLMAPGQPEARGKPPEPEAEDHDRHRGKGH